MESQNGKPLTKHEFDDWATATKQTLNSIEQNMVTKSDIADMVTKSDIKEYVSKKNLAESEKRVIDVIEKLSTRVKRVLDEDYPFQKKRISRVEFRTKRLLGKKLAKTDADFEEEYPGEETLTRQEARAE